MLHDETENPIRMIKVLEDRLLVRAVLMPDDWKPIAGHDQLWAGQQTGNEAVKLFEQHRVLAEGEQFLVKLLEADIGAPIPWQQFLKPTLREVGTADAGALPPPSTVAFPRPSHRLGTMLQYATEMLEECHDHSGTPFRDCRGGGWHSEPRAIGLYILLALRGRSAGQHAKRGT
jgi:hypothetical protein